MGAYGDCKGCMMRGVAGMVWGHTGERLEIGFTGAGLSGLSRQTCRGQHSVCITAIDLSYT